MPRDILFADLFLCFFLQYVCFTCYSVSIVARLIVVAEKQVVYKKFPIPLINRLQKHTLTMETILTDEQKQMTQELEMWAKEFVNSTATQPMHGYTQNVPHNLHPDAIHSCLHTCMSRCTRDCDVARCLAGDARRARS